MQALYDNRKDYDFVFLRHSLLFAPSFTHAIESNLRIAFLTTRARMYVFATYSSKQCMQRWHAAAVCFLPAS